MASLPHVEVLFLKEFLAAHSFGKPIVLHQFIRGNISRPQNDRPANAHEQIREVYERELGKSFYTRKKADFFSQLSTQTTIEKCLGGLNLIRDAELQILDQEFSGNAARAYIKGLSPTASNLDNIKFNAMKIGDAFLIDSNIDQLKYAGVSNNLLSNASIFREIITSKVNLGISSNFNGDLYTNRVSSQLIKFRLSAAATKADNFRSEVSMFSDLAMCGKSIYKSLASRNRNFGHILDVVEKAERFRKWTASIGTDKSLVKEYISELNSISWLDKLPNKAIRFSIFLGLGEALDNFVAPPFGKAFGIGVGLADQFLIDKIVKGWKPNHFINDNLMPVLD
ncbi:hypothetical protein [Paracoccus sediminilitoris]|uniref:hypothetical protein n=1 Tax=Paracoccus sediminilitoris TaxID=2202419 RepID=UPI00272A2833|nr:hypothetical protein [Paracoccus sediminilitoris]